MRITLLRHGQPELPKTTWIRACDFNDWINSYNQAPLATCAPPAATRNLVTSNPYVVCSHLPRSLESAAMLGCIKVNHSDSLLREMEMPCAGFLSPKLPLHFWTTSFRMAWFLGFSGKSESFAAAKVRAQQAAQTLAQLAATKQQDILFIGHGMLNRFIAKELRANNWQGKKNPGSRYWEFASYEKT